MRSDEGSGFLADERPTSLNLEFFNCKNSIPLSDGVEGKSFLLVSKLSNEFCVSLDKSRLSVSKESKAELWKEFDEVLNAFLS